MDTIQIRHFITGEVIYQSDKGSLREAVIGAAKDKVSLEYADLSGVDLSGVDLWWRNLSGVSFVSANLMGADLRGSDLFSADLTGAKIKGANLRLTNLHYANLQGVDLSSANIAEANLSKAKTDKRYVQVAGIGSAKRMTTYCFEDDKVWCGCFKGSLQEFEDRVISKYDADSPHGREYIGFINYIKSLI